MHGHVYTHNRNGVLFRIHMYTPTIPGGYLGYPEMLSGRFKNRGRDVVDGAPNLLASVAATSCPIIAPNNTLVSICGACQNSLAQTKAGRLNTERGDGNARGSRENVDGSGHH